MTFDRCNVIITLLKYFNFFRAQNDVPVLAGPLQPIAPHYDVPVLAGPLQPIASMAEERKKIKKQRALDRRNVARLTDEQRARLTEMRTKKEVGQFLLPDAAPNKKSRIQSPERVPCPLMPGTPEVAPPRIPQPWEVAKRNASGPSRVVLKEVHTPPQKKGQLVFTPSTGVITLQEDVVLDENLLVDAQIELVGFSPSITSTEDRPTLPAASSSAVASCNDPGPRSRHQDVMSWSRGTKL